MQIYIYIYFDCKLLYIYTHISHVQTSDVVDKEIS